MKTREEIEQIALERYPKTFGESIGRYDGTFSKGKRNAFIEGYLLSQTMSQVEVPDLKAGQEFFEAIERTCDFTPLLDDMNQLINALIVDNYRVIEEKPRFGGNGVRAGFNHKCKLEV